MYRLLEMSAFCVPTPCIVPLRLPVFGESKIIDTSTKIEILCDTELPGIEVFYTIDGTKPQPYVGIVQGSKTLKFIKPFTLPPGKITVKAMAIHSLHHSMCSNVITKTFYVNDVRKKVRKVRKAKPKQVAQMKTLVADFVSTDAGNSEKSNEPIHQEEEEEKSSDDFVDLPDEDGNDVCDTEERNEGTYIVNDALCDDGITENEGSDDTGSESGEVQQENDVQPEDDAPEFNDATFVVDTRETLDHSDPNTEVKEVPSHEVPHVQTQCEIPVQYCSACNKVNSLLARYCDSCGEKLHKSCSICKEQNPVVANYCQYCGNKFTLEPYLEKAASEKPKEKPKSRGVLVKPTVVSRGTSTRSVLATQSVQTELLISKVLGSPRKVLKCAGPEKVSRGVQTTDKIDLTKKKVPSSTPGRGYWRQQVDYICSHLKAHTNNNPDFRSSVGSPPLGQFLSADVTKDEETMSVTVRFEVLPQVTK